MTTWVNYRFEQRAGKPQTRAKYMTIVLYLRFVSFSSAVEPISDKQIYNSNE